MKKVSIILVSFLLATDAYGNALLAILRTPAGRQLLANVVKTSPNKLATLPTPKQVALYHEIMAKNLPGEANIEKMMSARDFLRPPADSSGEIRIEEIGEALALSVFVGNVQSYREQMGKLLKRPFSEFSSAGLGQRGIISEEILQMMHRHPIESVRHQFRRELYDLINHLNKAESPAHSSPLLPLPADHSSLFEAHIQKFVLEETPLGKAIVNGDAHEFREAYRNLLENESLEVVLAQLYAKSRSGEGLYNFAIQHMNPSDLVAPVLSPKLQKAIDKFNYQKDAGDIASTGALSGFMLGGAGAMLAMIVPDTLPPLLLLLAMLPAGGILGGYGFYKINNLIERAR